MTTPTFPERTNPALAPFWDGMLAGEIVMQHCTACGYLRWPPTKFCPECLSDHTEWQKTAPTGTLVSYATYHKAMNAASAGKVPYTIALVELDGGPKMYGKLLPDAAGAKVGARVRAVFIEAEPGVPYVAWELDKGSPGQPDPR